jgi:hypothetical protein
VTRDHRYGAVSSIFWAAVCINEPSRYSDVVFEALKCNLHCRCVKATIAGHHLSHPRYSVTAVFKDEIGIMLGCFQLRF